MKTSLFKIFFMAIAILGLYGCGENTEAVESGTYVGNIEEVEPEKTEIYVKTEEGQVLELYFTETTELLRNGEPVEFSVLEPGQRVEVEVEKVGQRLDPITVTVLE